jgi:hypothetical protein
MLQNLKRPNNVTPYLIISNFSESFQRQIKKAVQRFSPRYNVKQARTNMAPHTELVYVEKECPHEYKHDSF